MSKKNKNNNDDDLLDDFPSDLTNSDGGSDEEVNFNDFTDMEFPDPSDLNNSLSQNIDELYKKTKEKKKLSKKANLGLHINEDIIKDIRKIIKKENKQGYNISISSLVSDFFEQLITYHNKSEKTDEQTEVQKNILTLFDAINDIIEQQEMVEQNVDQLVNILNIITEKQDDIDKKTDEMLAIQEIQFIQNGGGIGRNPNE